MAVAIGSDPTFTPAEFVAVFNQSIEMMYPLVGVVGELSNLRISKGQWVYFDLKDEEASVKFFGTVRQQPGPLEDGMQLEVLGRPYLHPRFGFSIQVMSMRPVGEGTIKKAQDLLAAKLQTEGLFDDGRKRALPYPPERIALITSAQAAAYSDFTKIIGKRWPNLIIELFDVQVQGQNAPAGLVRAIEEVNQAPEPYDVFVMLRGGGSADDLAAFSNESVVRAVAGSRVPSMVAIGHERDVSLSELAADQRASTPSNAAELLVPDRMNEHQRLHVIQKQMNQAVLAKYDSLKSEIQDYDTSLAEAIRSLYIGHAEALAQKAEILRLLGPEMPLKRGYALVRDNDGRVVRSTKQTTPGDRLKIQISDGVIAAKVE